MKKTQAQIDREFLSAIERDDANEARRERNRKQAEERSEKWGEAQLVQRELSDGGRIATQPSASTPDLLG